VASVNLDDGAMADAETIRLGLGWGLVRGEGGGLAVGPHGCEPEKFQGLWGKSRSGGMTSCCIEYPAAYA
jgi:hypothetical protein